MGQNSKIRTLRKALRAVQEQHERYHEFTPAQRERWLSMAVRDALLVADERSRMVNSARQMKSRLRGKA